MSFAPNPVTNPPKNHSRQRVCLIQKYSEPALETDKRLQNHGKIRNVRIQGLASPTRQTTTPRFHLSLHRLSPTRTKTLQRTIRIRRTQHIPHVLTN